MRRFYVAYAWSNQNNTASGFASAYLSRLEPIERFEDFTAITKQLTDEQGPGVSVVILNIIEIQIKA